MAIVSKSKANNPKLYYKSIDFSDFLNGINTQYDESVLPIKYAKVFKNFCNSKGVLDTGLGLKQMSFPIDDPIANDIPIWDISGAKPLKVLHFKYWNYIQQVHENRLLVYADNGNIYWRKVFDNYRYFLMVLDMNFAQVPNLISYRLNDEDIGVFMSPENHLIIWNPGIPLETLTEVPLMTSMCLHYERVFATVEGRNTSIWFSDSMDPTNWNISSTEAGYFHLYDNLGGANKIISFYNYLYVFRDFGITKITAYADQSEFNVLNIYTSSNGIYADTVCVCGEVVYFLASDGLYAFNGVSVNKLNLNFEGIFEGYDNSKAKSEFHKNCYYLLCNTSMGHNVDGLGTLLEFNLETKSISLLAGYNFISMTAIRDDYLEKLVVIISVDNENIMTELTRDGKVLNQSTQKKWQSVYTDLGEPNRLKIVKKLSLISEGDCSVTITTESGSAVMQVKGSTLPTQIPLNISGYMISVAFETDEQIAKISHPELLICYK